MGCDLGRYFDGGRDLGLRVQTVTQVDRDSDGDR
jgi:hypothetical protein